MTFTKEDRVAQLKACAETIIEKAEEIIGDLEYPTNQTVTIHLDCQEIPTIKVEKEIIPQKIIELIGKGG